MVLTSPCFGQRIRTSQSEKIPADLGVLYVQSETPRDSLGLDPKICGVATSDHDGNGCEGSPKRAQLGIDLADVVKEGGSQDRAWGVVEELGYAAGNARGVSAVLARHPVPKLNLSR